MERPSYNQRYIHVGTTGYNTHIVHGSGHAHKINHTGTHNIQNTMEIQYNMHHSPMHKIKGYKPNKLN